MDATIREIFVTPKGGLAMEPHSQVEAMAGCGLRGDRYCAREGYWTGIDECEVTLIEAEDLEEIESTIGVHVSSGEHRRNLVTRGIRLQSLRGKRFQIGDAVLVYDRPRPPCSYVESITEPGMKRALVGRGGICARVVKSGIIRVGDAIAVLSNSSTLLP